MTVGLINGLAIGVVVGVVALVLGQGPSSGSWCSSPWPAT